MSNCVKQKECSDFYATGHTVLQIVLGEQFDTTPMDAHNSLTLHHIGQIEPTVENAMMRVLSCSTCSGGHSAEFARSISFCSSSTRN